MDDVERALPPLTSRDVEKVLWFCRSHKRKFGLLNVGSPRAGRLLGEILDGKPTASSKTNDEIAQLESEKQIRLLQLMLMGQFPDLNLCDSYAKAKTFDINSIARYMSEKTTLYGHLTRGMSRIETRM